MPRINAYVRGKDEPVGTVIAPAYRSKQQQPDRFEEVTQSGVTAKSRWLYGDATSIQFETIEDAQRWPTFEPS